MKRGIHLLVPGPAGVEGRSVMDIMLLLDGMSVGETKHKREKGCTPVMSVTKISNLCKCLASTKLRSIVAMGLPARVVERISTPRIYKQFNLLIVNKIVFVISTFLKVAIQDF